MRPSMSRDARGRADTAPCPGELDHADGGGATRPDVRVPPGRARARSAWWNNGQGIGPGHSAADPFPGAGDETAVLGGVGSCGRPVCCATWLREFRPLNVRMAKAQGISLNPTSINGYCGRLKCCLRYELEKPEAPGGSEREENET